MSDLSDQVMAKLYTGSYTVPELVGELLAIPSEVQNTVEDLEQQGLVQGTESPYGTRYYAP